MEVSTLHFFLLSAAVELHAIYMPLIHELFLGVYECQINTEPKMSLSYTLHIIGEYTLFIFVQV